jgi:hypothetical protein
MEERQKAGFVNKTATNVASDLREAQENSAASNTQRRSDAQARNLLF